MTEVNENPKTIPRGDARIRKVSQPAFYFSELANVSAQTGMKMQMKTWKKPIMNRRNAMI
jgi:hypothetical protein